MGRDGLRHRAMAEIAEDRVGNLGPVIGGNIIGGSVLVALVYRVIYLRVEPHGETPSVDVDQDRRRGGRLP